MAKQGMSRPEPHKAHENAPVVPQIQGKAKHGKKANPVIPGTEGAQQKVFHR